VVCYDAPLPGEYAAFDRQPACAYAWAWRVVAARPGAPHITLSWQPADDAAATGDAVLPFGLEALRFAVAGGTPCSRDVAGTRWTWTHDA